MQTETHLVTLEEILKARESIKEKVHRTPMAYSSYFSNLTGHDVSLKLELFQKTGSFKVRGVSNKMASLSPDEMQKGVITLSAGNAAQAVAWGATQYGVPSTVIMPQSSVVMKQHATRGYGGDVLLTDGNLLEYCMQVKDERGLTLVHPFDDLQLIAGHGSLGLEILEDLPECDVVFVGIGGGGLISGVATAVKHLRPQTKIIGVEPEGAPTLTNSLEKGEALPLLGTNTIADGLAAPFAGQHTFQHVKAFVDEVVLVSEDEIKTALRLIWERCKVMAEPAAAASVAALMYDKVELPSGSSVCCVISGGNVDLAQVDKLLQ
ncbi:MAG: threonine/serine dehydratase [Chloroflexota bacterium]